MGALMLVLGGTCWRVVGAMESQLEIAAGTTAKSVEQIGTLASSLANAKAAETGFILFSSLNDAAQIETNRLKFSQAAGEMQRITVELRPVVTGEAASALELIESGRTALARDFQQMLAFCGEQQCNQALEMHIQKEVPRIHQMETAASRLVARQHELLLSMQGESAARASLCRTIILCLIGLCLVLGLGIHIGIRGMTKRLSGFAERLTGTAGLALQTADQVSTASQGLARGTSEQASSIEETSATANEMAAMTRQNASNTQATAKLVRESDSHVEQANQTLRAMVESMKEINGSSEKVSRIIKIIFGGWRRATYRPHQRDSQEQFVPLLSRLLCFPS
jgi:hypothetical protein